jgi:hypothetical protein
MKLFTFFLFSWCLTSFFSQAQQESILNSSFRTDTITAASNAYSDVTVVKSLLMGKNYRNTWSTPVRLPVFYLSSSAFQVESLGGNKQTNSLYLRDSNETIWVLRSVDKDVSKGYPSILLPVIAFKQDLISANYPYGALVAAELMKACGISAAEPVYYFVADDEALGNARKMFANTVCMLEKREPGPTSITTDSLKILLHEESIYAVCKKQLLLVRMMDMFIGDSDRHEGQFRWAPVDSAGTCFCAIPRDRDFVFFSSGGLFPLVLELLTGRPRIRFSDSSSNMKKLNHKAQTFDRYFLKDLTEADWRETAQTVLNKMTDDVLASAVSRLPAELHTTDGEIILAKLKGRREDFIKNVMVYYRFLFPENR